MNTRLLEIKQVLYSIADFSFHFTMVIKQKVLFWEEKHEKRNVSLTLRRSKLIAVTTFPADFVPGPVTRA